MSEDETLATIGIRGAAPPVDVYSDERYTDRGLIDVGGMGEVRRVHDRVLDRVVARKIIAHDLDHDSARGRFHREAMLTARLQHPGIVPVYDLGTLEDGRFWYTMREVTGKTLTRVFSEAGDGERNLHGLVERLVALAETVAFAHGEGIVHGDLKPGNVMVGAFGEVQLLDWGIAVPSGTPLPDGLYGTPAYMPPEHAVPSAERVQPTADVYALGVMLYEVLSGGRPYGGPTSAVLEQLRAGPPPPLDCGEPELEELCRRAMERDPRERFADAGTLATALRDWLHGARRRERAVAAVARANTLREEAQELSRRIGVERADSARLLDGVPRNAPESAKHPGWDAAERAEALVVSLERARAAYVSALLDALREEPSFEDAHQRLADHHRVVADETQDPVARIRLEELVRRHDRGRHVHWLAGTGRVRLDSDPSGAEVWAARYRQHRRRLVLDAPQRIGRTPLDVELAEGSYLLELRAPGRQVVRYPILLERGETWDCTAPGETRPRPVRLPSEELDGCFVPAGWFWAGGDSDAPESLPSQRRWVDDFVVQSHPVTVQAYLGFLQDLLDRGRVDEARERGGLEGSSAFSWVEGRFVVAADKHGEPTDPQTPVTFIRRTDAQAYADWLGARTGRPWRLLHDLEWEKAARGVDRRCWPWGNRFDPTWARMQQTLDGPPRPARIDAHSIDVSPYGVFGMAGNVHDWCCSNYLRDGPEGARLRVGGDDGDPNLAMVRGGSWVSGPGFCRTASRLVGRPETGMAPIGMRLCWSVLERPDVAGEGVVQDGPGGGLEGDETVGVALDRSVGED